MTPPPEPRKPLVGRLFALHERLGRFAVSGMQAYLDWKARRRERRERRFARQDWIWLVCMILLGIVMVLQMPEHHETLPGLAVLFAVCLTAYLAALYSRRRIAARDEADRQDRP